MLRLVNRNERVAFLTHLLMEYADMLKYYAFKFTYSILYNLCLGN